jgi:hypothetical protein
VAALPAYVVSVAEEFARQETAWRVARPLYVLEGLQLVPTDRRHPRAHADSDQHLERVLTCRVCDPGTGHRVTLKAPGAAAVGADFARLTSLRFWYPMEDRSPLPSGPELLGLSVRLVMPGRSRVDVWLDPADAERFPEVVALRDELVTFLERACPQATGERPARAPRPRPPGLTNAEWQVAEFVLDWPGYEDGGMPAVAAIAEEVSFSEDHVKTLLRRLRRREPPVIRDTDRSRRAGKNSPPRNT